MINFVICQSKYGYFIVNRHDIHQYQSLKNDKTPHIDDEIVKITEICTLLGPNPVIIDGGSNIGLITIPIATLIKSKIISFEPQPQIFYALCGNIILNNLNNIIAINKGLGSQNKIMYVPYIDYNVENDFGDVELQESGTNSVEIITIDSLNLNKVDFIKLDVEGMEIEALIGAKNTIDRFRPWCWVEYFKSDLQTITTFFKSKNYNIFLVDKANLVAVPDKTVLNWMQTKIE